MNYASGIILFFLAIAVGYWFIQGRHDYVGPRISQPAAPDIPTRISTRRSTQEPESGVPRRLSFPTR